MSSGENAFNFSLLFHKWQRTILRQNENCELSIFLYCFLNENLNWYGGEEVLSIFLYCFKISYRQVDGEIWKILLSIFLYCFPIQVLSETWRRPLFQFFSIVSLHMPRVHLQWEVPFNFSLLFLAPFGFPIYKQVFHSFNFSLLFPSINSPHYG